MRYVLNVGVRAVIAAAAMVMMLGVPVQAMPAEAPAFGWFGRARDRVVKVIRKVTIRTFGDGLSDPKP
ncbi:MAG TPA: hypothetical protein VE010_11765 [Thermoanaerobaculia bacterium]|nr:hypothetical protein [Thermoanaerobaculia bacterium]